MTIDEMISLFRLGHESHGGRLAVIEKDQLGSALIQYLQNEDSITIQKKIDDEFQITDLLSGFESTHNIKVLDPQWTKDRTKRTLADTTASITNCLALIAFSGTCAMTSMHHGSRLLSLLPERHIVIAHVDQLVPDLDAFFNKFPDISNEMGSNLFFVTGPSRTADIEKTLVRGIHGPNNFDIILLR